MTGPQLNPGHGPVALRFFVVSLGPTVAGVALRAEDSLFAASDTFMSVQPLEDKLCSGDLGLQCVLGGDTKRRQPLQQTLDPVQPGVHLLGGDAVGQFDLAT
jgi:hypothetical protein